MGPHPASTEQNLGQTCPSRRLSQTSTVTRREPSDCDGPTRQPVVVALAAVQQAAAHAIVPVLRARVHVTRGICIEF